MNNIIIKTLKENWKFITFLSIITILTLSMYVSLFPSISKQSEEIEKMMVTFPKEIWQLFGIQDEVLSLSTLEKYISVEMFSIFWPILSIICFLNLSVKFIANEIETGTMEILLSFPMTRIKIYLAKLISGYKLISIFVLLSIYCLIPLARIIDTTINVEIINKLFLTAWLFTLAGFSFSLCLSAILKKGQVSLITTGSLLIMYVLNILATLKDNLDNLKYFSVFYYLDLPKVLTTDTLNIESIIVFVSVILISNLVGIVYFNKRDIYL